MGECEAVIVKALSVATGLKNDSPFNIDSKGTYFDDSLDVDMEVVNSSSKRSPANNKAHRGDSIDVLQNHI